MKKENIHDLSDAERQYYIGKILCAVDPENPAHFIQYSFHRIFIIFGYSASGKDTLINEFLKRNKKTPVTKFIRTMIRPRRSNEIELFDGFFVSKKLFHYLKNHGRFFYAYKRYGTEIGYDTLHLIFELVQKNVIMIGGTEKNYEPLIKGIRSVLGNIGITTIFINRPKEDVAKSLHERKIDPAESRRRIAYLNKEWKEEPEKAMDYCIWNSDIENSIHELKFIVDKLSLKSLSHNSR